MIRATITFVKAYSDINYVKASAQDFKIVPELEYKFYYETLTLSEVAVVALNKSFSDSFAYTDIAIVDMSKGLSDSFAFSDSASLDNAKALSDSYSFSDSQTYNVGKGLSETLSVSEQSVFSHNKILTDVFTLDDTALINKDCESVKGNVLSMTDSISISRTHGRALGNMVLGSLTLN